MKKVLIGLGNTIVSDDRIGIYLAERLEKEKKDFEIIKTSFSGFNLVDLMLGYEKVIVVDSIKTGLNNIGNIEHYSLEDFEDIETFSIHTTDLISAIRTMRDFKLDVPEDISFIAVEVKDITTFKETFSDEIESLKNVIYENIKNKVFKIMEEV